MMGSMVEQIRDIGLQKNDSVVIHSSYKSLGINDPEIFIRSLLEIIGDRGTLLMPGLSYLQVPQNIHNTNTTPTCVGFLSEYFRKRPGTIRSIHPTHSVCGIGDKVHELLDFHILDNTPCGHNSPFNKLFFQKGKILMVGCGLMPNTSMHAIEEYVQPPYLFGPPMTYTITDAHGITFNKTYITHNFRSYTQRYDRVQNIFDGEGLQTGVIGNATAYLLNCEIFFKTVLEKIRKNPLYFIDKEIE